MATTMRSQDSYLTPQRAYNSPANGPRNPDHSSPGQPIASSPLLGDAEYRRAVFASERTSRASSIRLSREFDSLRWDGTTLEDSELTEDDSILKENKDPGPNTLDVQTTEASRASATSPDAARQDTGDLNSYSALSKRADFILASAKRKLNLLEGDIKGARHSLMAPPRPSRNTMDPFGGGVLSGSLSSSLGGEDSLRSTATNGTSPSSNDDTALGRANRGHTRVFSDTSIPSPRGPAAKGSLGLENVRNRQTLNNGSANFHNDSTLEPVIEDKVSTEYNNNGRTTASSDPKSTPRATNAQLLRSEAEELKDRLSLIQQRVRQDAQKRRSLQGPTAGWTAPEDDIVQQIQALQQSLYQQESVIDQLERVEDPAIEPAKDPREEWQRILNNERYEPPVHLDQGSGSSKSREYSDGEEELPIEMDEQPPFDDDDDEEEPDMDGAHEDRADAFDYEHFILHSVLGNYSSTARRYSGSSVSKSTTHDDEEGERALEEEPEDASDLRSGGSEYDEDTASLVESQKDTHEVSDPREKLDIEDLHDEEVEEEEEEEEEEEGEGEDGPLLEEELHNSWPMPPASNNSREASTVFSDLSDAPLAAGESAEPAGRNINSNMLVPPPAPTSGHRPASRIFSALIAGHGSKLSTLPRLNEEDQALVYKLSEALRNACLQLQRNPSNEQQGVDWRRRVEQARQILAGEL